MKTIEWIVGLGINNPLFQVNACLIGPISSRGISGQLEVSTNRIFDFKQIRQEFQNQKI